MLVGKSKAHQCETCIDISDTATRQQAVNFGGRATTCARPPVLTILVWMKLASDAPCSMLPECINLVNLAAATEVYICIFEIAERVCFLVAGFTMKISCG